MPAVGVANGRARLDHGLKNGVICDEAFVAGTTFFWPRASRSRSLA